MTQKSYYEILDIPIDADYIEIKKAYLQLAKKLHPDKIPNATESDQFHFSKITEAYDILSNLDKRRKYDQILNANSGRQQNRFWHPHYSGYPYFRYDIFTPFIHEFFMSRTPSRKSKQTLYLSIFLNWRVILVSIIGTLVFFKFFTSMEGKVRNKTYESGWDKNFSYYLEVEDSEGKIFKKKIRRELHDYVNKDDQILKHKFSFFYLVNGRQWSQITPKKFLVHTGIIYGFFCAGLIFIENSRK